MEYSYKSVKENIEENKFQIKKKFGQNFIIDNNIFLLSYIFMIAQNSNSCQ